MNNTHIACALAALFFYKYCSYYLLLFITDMGSKVMRYQPVPSFIDDANLWVLTTRQKYSCCGNQAVVVTGWHASTAFWKRIHLHVRTLLVLFPFGFSGVWYFLCLKCSLAFKFIEVFEVELISELSFAQNAVLKIASTKEKEIDETII